MAYQRLISGLIFHKSEHIRFLTLTNGIDGSGLPAVPLEKQVRKFAVFVRWIRKTYGELEYFSVHTNEGNGVFHCLITGPFLPVNDLRKKWVALTGAWRLNIQLAIKEGDLIQKKLFHEMTRQHDVIRYSCSQGWLPANAIKAWNTCRNFIGTELTIDGHQYVFRKSSAILLFNSWLCSYSITSVAFYQDYLIKHRDNYLLGVV